MESFQIAVTNPIKKINFKGIDYFSEQGLESLDDTNSVIDENMTPHQQVEILEKALERTRENAFQAGYEEGRNSSLHDMESRIKELSSDFTQMVQGLDNQYKELFNLQEKTLLKLSLRIAEKILCEELSHKKDVTEFLAKMLKKILMEMMEQKKITVFLNPDWLKELNRDEFMDHIELPLHEKIQFVENDKLNPGECLVESEDYFIDTTLNHQLKLIENHLRQEYSKWN